MAAHPRLVRHGLPGRGSHALLLAAALLTPAAGCGLSAEEREAAAVLHAADALRDAPSQPAASRVTLLADLERTPAASPAAVEARDTCVKAYRPLLEVATLQPKIQALLADPSKIDPGTLAELAEAERKVKESTVSMPACNRALAELRRKARGPG
jgi:hypothetical protein